MKYKNTNIKDNKQSLFSRLFSSSARDSYYTTENALDSDWFAKKETPKVNYKINIHTYRFAPKKRNEFIVVLNEAWYPKTQTYIIY